MLFSVMVLNFFGCSCHVFPNWIIEHCPRWANRRPLPLGVALPREAKALSVSPLSLDVC